MDVQRIAIVGGGITGLTAAMRLLKQASRARHPVEVTIYEASNRVGGKVLTYRDGGLTLEAGPDSMLARKPAGVGLIRELGLESELIETNPEAKNTYIVRDGRLVPMPHGTFMGIPADISTFMTNEALSASGKFRALFDLLIPPSPLSADMSLGTFLRSRLGDEWVTYLGEPLLAGIYAGRIDDLSLKATWGPLRDLALKYRSLVVGSRAMLNQQAVKKTGRSAFVTVRGGLETVIERLADELADKATIRLSHEVTEIERSDVGYHLTVENGDETIVTKADAMIICTPPAAMKSLLKPYLPASTYDFQVPYVSTATVIVGYPSDHVNIDLRHASGFLVPRAENRAITASTWVSSKWPHTTNEQFIVLRCYVGRAGQQTYLELDDGEMVRMVAREVNDLVGISATPVFHKVTRWENAMPNYLVGHLERLDQLEQAIHSTLPGVEIAGAGYHGLGLPDCIAQANDAAERILSYLTGSKSDNHSSAS
ncbi:protoporphyrinogen oxidase [Alicyclobacillus dauci]|uniref:Coproporphyrinogen III oxidase n=1 Tax=Alicyclobacillus dauci TaxID=1475485 RepID=A0ABY6Z6C7_9BACL|nr:protoporphyrinogen oxidase [Alicyclobacillus dauci]WAH38453.1 protoporphyrinogen oxidase [Alicyclobacillus dauci]